MSVSVYNVIRVFILDGEKRYRKFPIIKTTTGWHCFCRSLRRTDFKEFGVGHVLYFKFSKYFAMMFAVFTILSIPNYLIYSSGGNSQASGSSSDTTVRKYLSLLSMGNMAVCNIVFLSLIHCIALPICASGDIVNNETATLSYACTEGGYIY